MAEFTVEIPEGFEPIHKDILKCFREANYQEYYLKDGEANKWPFLDPSSQTYLILRKIEKPKSKQYRQFASAAEFEPYRDRWIKRSFESSPDAKGCFKAEGYDDYGIYTTAGLESYEDMFEQGRQFDDGTPFGVEE